MKCAVCGMEYGMTHNCAGARPVVGLPEVAEGTPPPPSGFLPLHYVREAIRIAIWDGDAIRRVARDRQALPYGIMVWAIANSIPLLFLAALSSTGHSFEAGPVLVGMIFLLVRSACFSLAQVGLCFLIAKSFMGGEGRFLEILRPLLLGSVVYLLLAIPVAGIFFAAIAWICVFAMVFQVVADVEAFSAYILSIVVGIAFRILESKLIFFSR